MADYRIDCVNKPDRLSPHEHITNVGGPTLDGSSRWKDAGAPYWSFRVENRQTGRAQFSRRRYLNEDSAKNATLDALIWAKQYL